MEKEATVLIVDDHQDLLENISLALEMGDYEVLTASDGLEALEVLETHTVDLILADIAMPRLNGYQLFERVREHPGWVKIPFLFLTARALDSDVRYGKELGADDYLTKPIQPEDLLAAVRGRLRRASELNQTLPDPTGAAVPKNRVLKLGLLQIDPDQYQTTLDGQSIKLSAKEFKLLYTLASRAGEVVSPQELIQVTHDFDTDAIEAGSLLRPLIRSLRRKLGYEVGEMGLIENIRGVGYRFVPPEI